MNNQDLESILMDEDALTGLAFAPFEQQQTLLGAIARMPIAKQVMATQKLLTRNKVNVGGGAMSDRDMATIRLGALPENVRKALAEKRAQLSESAYYVVKPFTGSIVRMFESDDDKGDGIGNIAKSQLDKDFWFMLTGIILQQGTDATPGTKGQNAPFDTVSTGIANGNFEFKANGNKYLLPKDTSCAIFNNANEDKVKGYFKLSNPKWIEPQSDINFDIRSAGVPAANQFLKLVLMGVTVLPY